MTTRKPLFIFDLDGTVSDDRWRRCMLPKDAKGNRLTENDGTASDADYKAYHDALTNDAPLYAGAVLLRAAIKDGASISFSTARPNSHRGQTAAWLRRNFGEFRFSLFMRDENDARTSPEIKLAHLRSLWHSYGYGPIFFYDDREDVCHMAFNHGCRAYVMSSIGIYRVRGVFGLDRDHADLSEGMKEAHRVAGRYEKEASQVTTAGERGEKIHVKNFVDTPKVAATEVTETVGEIVLKTRVEFLQSPDDVPGRDFNCRCVMARLKAEDDAPESDDLTEEIGERVRAVMVAMFPQGFHLKTAEDYERFDTVFEAIRAVTTSALMAQK